MNKMNEAKEIRTDYSYDVKSAKAAEKAITAAIGSLPVTDHNTMAEYSKRIDDVFSSPHERFDHHTFSDNEKKRICEFLELSPETFDNIKNGVIAPTLIQAMTISCMVDTIVEDFFFEKEQRRIIVIHSNSEVTSFLDKASKSLMSPNYNLFLLRSGYDLRRSEVAALLGITPEEYIELEEGTAYPSLKLGLMMAKLFDVDVKTLFVRTVFEYNGNIYFGL